MMAMLRVGKSMKQLEFSYNFSVNAKLLKRNMKLPSKEKG